MAILLDYHTLPLNLLHQVHYSDIGRALIEKPENVVRDLVKTRVKRAGPIRLSWDDVYVLSEELEEQMCLALSRRPVAFWLHLYRRIAPAITQGEGVPMNRMTALLVRDISENAIIKFGSQGAESGLDVLTNENVEAAFGGWLGKAANMTFKDPEQRQAILNSFVRSPQWGIVDFNEADLLSIYFVEGLSYWYWKATARLRSVGKGAELYAFKDGTSGYAPNVELNQLLVSYDERAARHGAVETTSLGIWFKPRTSDSQSTIMSFSPNVDRIETGSYFEQYGLDLTSGKHAVTSNFLPVVLDGESYIKNHEYVADAYATAKGFTIPAVIETLHYLGAWSIGGSRTDHEEVFGKNSAQALSILRMMNRAYTYIPCDTFKELLRSLKEHLLKNSFASDDSEVGRLIESLTLTGDNRERIGLWSRGPRFPIIAFGSQGWLIDLYGLQHLLANLFFGVRDDAQVRGLLFEENVRASLSANGMQLERRNFKFFDGTNAEADAVFFREGKLIVADCLSVWRPVNFEIGLPKTIAHRCREIENKLDYSIARVEKLKLNPKGKNYDFTRASEIVPIVVTPFVEWLWNSTPKLWLDSGTPRVMQADELLEWAKVVET